MNNKIKRNRVICFDIDGVICKTSLNNYKNSIPIKKNIKIINELYKRGYFIKLFTARFMGRTNDNQKLAKSKARNKQKSAVASRASGAGIKPCSLMLI